MTRDNGEAKAAAEWTGQDPEDIDLDVSVEKGLRSFGCDQGGHVIDAERSYVSEHPVHHFHSLVHERIWS
jgi:choline monooxygenase